MVIIFLLAFAICLGFFAILGAKASKAARKAKMRQDLSLLNELMDERQNFKNKNS